VVNRLARGPIDHAMPRQIVRQIFRRDPAKSRQPLSEERCVGLLAVDMREPTWRMASPCVDEGSGMDSCITGQSPKSSLGGDDGGRLDQAGCQDAIQGREAHRRVYDAAYELAQPVTREKGDHDVARDGEAVVATGSWDSPEIPLPLSGTAQSRLRYLHAPDQLLAIRIERAAEPMAPTERGARMDTEPAGRFSNRNAFP
jgi:hypothetical protein